MRRIALFSLLIVSTLLVPAHAQTTLTVWYAGAFKPQMDMVNNVLVPAFGKAHPGIQLQIEFIPWGELSARLSTAFAAGTAPDVFMHGQAATAELAVHNRVEPLDHYFATLDVEDFGPTLDQGSYGGARYLAPVFGSGRLLLYRTDFFKEAGLDPATPPRTWEELLRTARALTVRDGAGNIQRAGLFLASSGINLQQVFAPFLWQAGGDWFSPDGHKVTFNTPAAVEATRFLQELFAPGTGVSPLGEDPERMPVHPLITGRAAMVFATLGEAAAIRTTNPAIYELLRAAGPTSRETKAALLSFAGFFISRDSKHKDAAWTFIRFALRPEMLSAFNEAGNSLPPRLSLAEAPFIARDHVLRTFSENLRYGRGNPNVPIWVRARDITSAHLEAAVHGRLEAQAAVELIHRDIERLLNP